MNNFRRKSKITDELIVYWAPSLNWSKDSYEVKIETYSYSGFVVNIFPEFYLLTQNGIKINELIRHFSGINSEDLNIFITDLINKRILVESVLSPKEIFHSQERLFQNPYKEEYLLDPNNYSRFKKSQLNRKFEKCIDEKITILDLELPAVITNRKTCRVFKNTKISFETFSKLLTAFKQKRSNEGIKYNYASAGGLYPIDMFLYVKENRVENVKAGLYYYNPVNNQLELVSKSCVITKDAHYHVNKTIFESSAFSLFLVYDASVTMPRYQGMGYFYACIEVGIMVGLLTQIAELNQIGLCSIGEMNFNKVEKYLKLNKNQVFLHAIELGPSEDA